jgi:thiol-disulfide isomerase/thioredoxin
VVPTVAQSPYSFEALAGADGRRYSLSSFEEKRVVVVVFAANGCPTVRGLEPLFKEFQRQYERRGVQLLLVNSNNSALSPPDTYAEVVKRAQESGFAFPYLKDEGGVVARRFGALTTPHAFVLDKQRRLRYRGRIADSRQASTVTTRYLDQAVDDILASRDVAVPETEPYGCSIIW